MIRNTLTRDFGEKKTRTKELEEEPISNTKGKPLEVQVLHLGLY